MAANIQAYLENLRQPWGQIYYDILFEQLQDIKGKRVLDFGSGFGLVANHLAQDNEVLAVEPNEEMVALRVQDHPYQQLVGKLLSNNQMCIRDRAQYASFCQTAVDLVSKSNGSDLLRHFCPPLQGAGSCRCKGVFTA